jgi:hypothetical protein
VPDTRPLSEVLSVAAVLARYGLRDARAARRIMDEAGGFLIGGRLVVRAADLAVYEERLRSARTGSARTIGKRPDPVSRSERKLLPPDWWRDGEPG